MIPKLVLLSVASLTCLAPTCIRAEARQPISIQVLDEDGKPVEDAHVQVRYLATVKQDAKEYRVPMELAPAQTTDSSGQCKLELHDVDWELAAIEALRAGLSSAEVDKLYDNAPKETEKLEAFEREVKDRGQRFIAAYQVLTPDMHTDSPIIMKMAKAVKLNGHVHVDGKPLAKALLTVYSPKTQIGQLFPQSGTVLTDQQGRFDFYSIPGKLDRVRIVVERKSGNRVLDLADVPSKQTANGLVFELDTRARDYIAE
jgi:hypothetical protein